MRSVYAAWEGSPENGTVSAVQDCFGKQFRRMHSLHNPGDVIASKLQIVSAPKKLELNGEMVEVNCRIVKRVHPNTVYAVLRRGHEHHRVARLARGIWYEVHGD